MTTTRTAFTPVTFATKQNFAVGTKPQSVSVGDFFNNDGKLDVVTANSDSNSISVLTGDGKGNFGTQTTFAVGNYPTSVSVKDLNGDGNTDVITTNALSNNVSVLLGNGQSNFSAQTNFAVGLNPVSVSVADVNGDSNADLVTANWGDYNVSGSYNVSVLLGNGKGDFKTQKTFEAGVFPRSLSVGDINSDGNVDLVTANPYASYTKRSW